MLVCLGILGVLLLPIMDMLITSNRAAVSARRMLDSTLYAQRLLEMMAGLTPADLPKGPIDLSVMTLADLQKLGQGRWGEAVPDLSKAPPFQLEGRSIQVRPLGDGKNVEIIVTVEWQGVYGDKKTKQKIELREVSVAREQPGE